MANRAYFQMLASLVERLSYIQGSFVSDGSGGVTSVQGSGVDTVVNLATGVYQIKLQDSYNKLLDFQSTVEELAGTPVLLTTGLSNTTVYQITTVGTPVNGTAVFTISSGSGILQATIDGVLIQTTWASSDTASATAMAAAINANALLSSLGHATSSSGVVTYTVFGGGVVSSVAAGTGFTVGAATSTGQLSVAAQWQAVGLAVGVTPAVGVAFLSNSAGAQAGASATAAAGPLLATAVTLGQVANIVGHPSTTLSTSGTSASGKGGYLVVVFRSGIGVATNPPAGTVRFSMHLRNSSIKGKGE